MGAEWWQEINQARTNLNAVLERIAKLMALKAEQEEYEDYVHVEHGTDKDGNPVSHGWTEAEHLFDYYLEGLDQRLRPSDVRRMKEIYYGLKGIPFAVFVDNWVRDEYPTSKARTLQEARSAIDKVIEYFWKSNNQ